MINETYNIGQLQEASLDYFGNDNLASSVWINKYALKNNGAYTELTPDDTLKRISSEIHRAESKFSNPLSYEQIYGHLKDFGHFIFAGSILFGAGNKSQVSSLGNCFFIDNAADSYGAIFNMDETMAQLMKRRGGVGVTIENLRPSSASVNNSAQSSTGAVSFMDRFSHTTREVAQDGRRGALMISMHVNHPDIAQFIDKKDDLTKVTGANVSIKVTDEFMESAENNEDYILSWPTLPSQPKTDKELEYNKLYKNEDGTYIMKVKAKEIWDKLVFQAHKNAEPGVLFWDNIIKESPADCYSKDGFITRGTNPCGEVPLSAYDSCRLGSINLSNMVSNPYQKNAVINWDLLVEVSRFAQRVMDDVIELEEEKVNVIIEKIKGDSESPELKAVELKTWENVLKVLKNGRRTGIGVLGLGDMLAKLGVQYGSKEATSIINELHKVIAINVYKETVNLAKERGAFPIWNHEAEKSNPFIVRVISDNFSAEEYADYITYGRRNIASLSIAPTGSLAIAARTTSGIEPVFKVRSLRRKKINPNDPNSRVDFVDENGDSWEEYNVFHYEFLKWFGSDESQKNLSTTQLSELLQDLSESELDELVAKSPWAGSESHDIDYLEKVQMQGVIQKWIDHSISVTHNVPKDITLKEVNDIYFEAWKAGCKGCTIYREGSRSGVLLTGKEEKDDDFVFYDSPKRPKELPADYFIAKADGKEFAVMIGLWPGTNRPYEVFAFENPPASKNTKGKIVKVKKGHYKFINGEFEIEDIQLAAERVEQRTLTLTASMLLRQGAHVNHIINVIKKIDENVTSFSSVVRRYLSRYAEVEEVDETCPECKAGTLIREEGCIHCDSCSYSRCG